MCGLRINSQTTKKRKMKVTAILKGAIDQDGLQPIVIRINEGEKRTFRATTKKVKPKEFERGRVTNKHPHHKQWNEQLERLKWQIREELESPLESKAPEINFLEFCRKELIRLTDKKEHKAATLRNMYNNMNRVSSFAPKLNLSEITEVWLEKFAAHQLAKGRAKTSVINYLTYIKTLVKRAYRNKLITVNPFEHYEMPKIKEKEDAEYLHPDQVKALYGYSFLPNSKPLWKEAATWFSIGCLTALRYADMKAFDRRDNIHHTMDGTILRVCTKKSDTIINVPISPELRLLFEEINYQPLSLTCSVYNQYLKNLARKLGINKINPHMSRHTAAMTWANNGLPIEICREVMGHKDIKTTDLYYKIAGKRVIDAFDKIKEAMTVVNERKAI